MAPATPPAVRQHPNYVDFKRLPVFGIRVAAHSLGRQYQDAKSENHVSIYLLLGRNRSLHMDMRPKVHQDHAETTGELSLKGRDFALSTSVIKFSDLNAVGCPAGFLPHTNARPSSFSRTVNDFRNFVIENHFPHFRFTFTDGHNLGCRYWVFSLVRALQQGGYLAGGVNLQEGEPSLMQLVTHKWDRDRPSIREIAMPGLLLRRAASHITTERSIELLRNAPFGAMELLCDALSSQRDEQLVIPEARAYIEGLPRFIARNNQDLAGAQAQGTVYQVQAVIQQKAHYLAQCSVALQQIARMASPAHRTGFEASQAYDMMCSGSNEYFAELSNALEGKYNLAVRALRSSMPVLAQYRQTGNVSLEAMIYAQMLAAVVDISGAEDASDSEEDANASEEDPSAGEEDPSASEEDSGSGDDDANQ